MKAWVDKRLSLHLVSPTPQRREMARLPIPSSHHLSNNSSKTLLQPSGTWAQTRLRVCLAHHHLTSPQKIPHQALRPTLPRQIDKLNSSNRILSRLCSTQLRLASRSKVEIRYPHFRPSCKPSRSHRTQKQQIDSHKRFLQLGEQGQVPSAKDRDKETPREILAIYLTYLPEVIDRHRHQTTAHQRRDMKFSCDN